MAKIEHRASFLQAFHSAMSETARKAMIESWDKIPDAPEACPELFESDKPFNTGGTEVSTYAGKTSKRTLSSKQVDFVISLLNQKDLSTLTLTYGQTIDPTQIRTMEYGFGKALLDKLINLPNKPSQSVKVTNQGSDKQKNFLKSLMTRHNISEADINEQYSNISDAISGLLKLKTPAKSTITEGAYWHNGLIARVQKSRQGNRLYVKLQTEVGGDVFEYVPGVINQLKEENKLSLTEMQLFAQQYSACADCGTPMSNPISIARGVGPVCSGKGYKL